MKNQKQKRNIKTIISIGLVVVVVVVLLGNLVRDDQNQNSDSAVNTINGRDSETLRVTLQGAKDSLDVGEALFVDVRSITEYESSHIPGAVLIPLNDIEGNEPDVEKDALIYTYCT